VQRTRTTLRAALIALIEERGWDSISVNDICDRADVGRSTFYTHFGDKEDLLTGGFDDLRKLISSLRPSVPPRGVVLGFSAPLLEHVSENRRLFRALVGKRSGLVVQRHFRELVVELTESELTGTQTVPHLAALVRYVAGAFFELVLWWLDSPRPIAAREVDTLFQQLTSRVVAAARSPRLTSPTKLQTSPPVGFT
jgi:AcrR family transcriptional regulator